MYENLFYDPRINALYTDEAIVKYMLQFEIALAQAQAAQGIIPPDAAKAIETVCVVENIDFELLKKEIRLGANVPIPLIKQLTKHLNNENTEGGKYIHFGTTSQDVIDTAEMLQIQEATNIFKENLNVLIDQLVFLIKKHRHTLMIGRSFMQHAKPITFGFKVATWLDGLLDARGRIGYISQNCTLQLGGAVGNLSGMPTKSMEIIYDMSGLLGLRTPSQSWISWHTQRDRFVEIATHLGIFVGHLSKIAKDISLLMQTEIGEVFEPSGAGKGGSSTMPHKRNPVSCIAILAIAQRVPPLVSTMLSNMTQDHERATGAWHAEWETLADIVKLSGGALLHAVEMTNGLEVNSEKMLKNMDYTEGLIFAENVSLALASKIGKAAAHDLVEEACKTAILNKKHLKNVLKNNDIIKEKLSKNELENCFNPHNSLGLNDLFIDNILNAV